MATNPYSYGSLGQRWTVGEPTSKSLLDISRVKNDANRWTLEQLITDPDDSATLGFGLSFESSEQRLLQIHNTDSSKYFQIYGGRSGSPTGDYLVFSTGTNGTIMEFDGANHWITFHDTAGVQKMYYRGDGSPGLTLGSGVFLTVGGLITADAGISGTTGTFSGDLTVGTTDLVVDVTANKVGIGGTPTEELDIQGSGATQTIRLIRTDASTAGGITINSANSSNYLYNTAAKDLVLSADNGATQTKLHSNGDFSVNSYKIFLDNATSYVGIATLSPNARLDVNGDIRYEGRILPTSAASDGTAAAPSIVVGGDYDNGFFRPTSNTIGFTTGGVERARIDSSGNVGIGTASPSLQAWRTNTYLTISNGTDGGVVELVTSASDASLNKAGAILWGATGNTTNHKHLGGIEMVTEGSTATQRGAYMRLLTKADGTAQPTERVRILSSGGITFNGDTSTANALDDYEEGTWTPAFHDDTTLGLSYSQQDGSYTKIGRLVYAKFRITVSAKTGSSSTQGFFIKGLPFNIAYFNTTVGTLSGSINTASNITDVNEPEDLSYVSFNGNSGARMLSSAGTLIANSIQANTVLEAALIYHAQ